MVLPTSGNPISLNQIHVEAGGTTSTEASLNDVDIRGLGHYPVLVQRQMDKANCKRLQHLIMLVLEVL